MMNQYDESAVVQFLGLPNMFTVKGFSETGPFGHLTNHVFRTL